MTMAFKVAVFCRRRRFVIMKKIITVFVPLVLSFCLLFMIGCGGGQMDKIKERGQLRVGIKSDVPSFGYFDMDSEEFDGIELDIAREIAKAMLKDETAVSFRTVTSTSRAPSLKNSTLDLIIATFTITEVRKTEFEFSRPYYIDEIGFLVMRKSNISNTSQMNGKTIGVVKKTTAIDSVKTGEISQKADFTEVKEYSSYPEIKSALTSGEIDIFAGDKAVLLGYNDGDTVLLDEGYMLQPYGIAAKLGEKSLSDFVDKLLGKMEEDGTLKRLYEKHKLSYSDFTAKKLLLG